MSAGEISALVVMAFSLGAVMGVMAGVIYAR